MRLQVGELATRAGLTVRTLHHYDAIGLLKPSARSAAGYRLYDQGDIARLHAIQALRHLGLRLDQIGELLAGGGAALPLIIGRQIEALEREIDQAGELRARLLLLQQRLTGGAQPELDQWLSTLALMETYGKYFSAAELKEIFRSWKETEAEWPPLIEAARAAMRRGLAPESPEMQRLARHWMYLSSRAMGGDLTLLQRWKSMHAKEPALGRRHIERALDQFMQTPIRLRMTALRKHFTPAQLRRLNTLLYPEWQALNQAVRAALQRGAAPHGKRAQQLAAAWNDLLDRSVDGDPALRLRLLEAQRGEPVLQAGSLLDPEVHEFLRRAAAPARKKA